MCKKKKKRFLFECQIPLLKGSPVNIVMDLSYCHLFHVILQVTFLQPYCKLKLVIQLGKAFIPCVATRFTMISLFRKSIWSHWSPSSFRGNQVPSLNISLLLVDAWSALSSEEALICPSEMAPFPYHRGREILYISLYLYYISKT